MVTNEGSWRERKKQLTRLRISQTALDLYAERGYANVSAAQIAAAAEVSERTLYRYFGDRDEILFSGDEEVTAFLVDRLRSRPRPDRPGTALSACFTELAEWWQPRHQEGRQRQAVIDSSPALQARENLKLRTHRDALAPVLLDRGLDPHTATLLAGAALSVAHTATVAWLAQPDPDDPTLPELTTTSFYDLVRLW